jgi:hypothetical protein
MAIFEKGGKRKKTSHKLGHDTVSSLPFSSSRFLRYKQTKTLSLPKILLSSSLQKGGRKQNLGLKEGRKQNLGQRQKGGRKQNLGKRQWR